jgi:hypothetical protein
MMPFSSIVALDKRNTALVIPNAIEISTRATASDEIKVCVV